MLSTKDEIKLMMGMIHMHEGCMYNSFKDYLLSEAISIKNTKYGTNEPNFDNLNILNNTNHQITFFESSGLYIVDIKPTNEVIFSKLKTFQSIYDFTTYKIITKDMNQFKIFGKVMYVIISMMNSLNIKSVWFDGLTDKHTEIYTNLFNNKYIQKEAGGYKIDLDITNQLGVSKFYIKL